MAQVVEHSLGYVPQKKKKKKRKEKEKKKDRWDRITKDSWFI
jgi:hypothetical protein